MPVLTVQMTQQDLARLDTLAKQTYRTRSDLVRAALSRLQIVQPDLPVIHVALDGHETSAEMFR
jgi:Arc/MetJ-type ribon-helix-helix transcriptional regulator